MANNVIPTANKAENNYLTAKLVSSMASTAVDNMHSFFSACELGAIPNDDLQKNGPSGNKFRVPIGMSDNRRAYTKEAYEFDFDAETARYTRDFSLNGIVGLWIPLNKRYYVESFINPLIVSMINEASIRQFNKFLDNALIYSDSAFNVLSSVSGSISCGSTPDIAAIMKNPSSIKVSPAFANLQSQSLHNQAINSLGLLGSGRVSGVGNLYSSKALSGVASFNQESFGNQILEKFTVVNQGTQSIHYRDRNALSACFMYADVSGEIEGPISLMDVEEYIVDNNNITAIRARVNTTAANIVKNLSSGPEIIVLAEGEPFSVCGNGAARYIYRAGEYMSKNPGEGGTFVVAKDVSIDLSETAEIIIELKQFVPVAKEGKEYVNGTGEYAPVMSINQLKPEKASVYSFDAPVIQQNCKGIKVQSWPWVISDPLLFMQTNTPYQYIRPGEMQAIDSETETWENQQTPAHKKNSIEMMLYSQGNVVTNSNVMRLEMYVDVGLNNKTYCVGMIPRVINYFDFFDKEPDLSSKKKLKSKA